MDDNVNWSGCVDKEDFDKACRSEGVRKMEKWVLGIFATIFLTPVILILLGILL